MRPNVGCIPKPIINSNIMSEQKPKSWKKNILEMVLVIGGIGLLYATGLQAEFAGFMQRMLLKVGFQNAAPAKADAIPANFDVQLTSLDGNLVSLQDLKGKTIFLNFWATWCPPCIAEMPDIHQLYGRIDQNKVAFVMVSTDENQQKLHDFLKKKGYTFPVYQLAGNLPAVYSVNSIPTTFIISPEGQIVYQHVGMANYNTDEFKDFLEGK
jgi:thiol-disulfide isomerase/thioredoxin